MDTPTLRWLHPFSDPLLFFLLSVVICGIPKTTTAQTVPTVVLTEIAWQGSSASVADEWVELTNTSLTEIDIGGWSLVGASSQPIIFPHPSTIAPQTSYLLSNYEAPSNKTVLRVPTSLVTTALSLSNTQLEITLQDAEQTTRDIVTLKPDQLSPSDESDVFRTAEREEDGTWFASPTLYDDTAPHPIYGTPGVWLSPKTATEPVLEAVETVIGPESDTDIPLTLEQILEEAPNTPEDLLPLPVTEEESETSLEAPQIHTTEKMSGPQTTEAPTDETSTVLPVVMAETLNTPPTELFMPVTVNERPVDVPVDPSTTEMEPLIEAPSTTDLPIENTEMPLQEALLDTSNEIINETLDQSSAAEAELTTNPLPSPLDVRISEIYPSPLSGEKEWVELEVEASPGETYSLLGWTLTDASGAVTALEEVSDRRFVKIDSPKGKLNNESETLTLRDQNNITHHHMTYGGESGVKAPKVGESLSIIDGIWQISTPSPGTTNRLMATPTLAPETVHTPESVSRQDESHTPLEEVRVVTSIPRPVETMETVAIETLGSQETSEPPIQNVASAIAATGSVLIVRALPHPHTGKQEELVLRNTSSASLLLDAWTLEDATGTRYVFPKETHIEAEAELTITDDVLPFRLQNEGGERLILKERDGSIIDQTFYNVSAQGIYLERVGDELKRPTPISKQQTSIQSTKQRSVQPSPTIPLLAIAAVDAALHGKNVRVEGVVSAVSGSIAKKTFFIVEEGHVLEIYAHATPIPSLNVGDRVRVLGEVRSLKEGVRINISNTSDVSVIGREDLVFERSQEHVDPLYTQGLPIHINGRILERLSNKLILSNEEGEWNVLLSSLSDPVMLDVGQTIGVFGVVRNSDPLELIAYKISTQQEVLTAGTAATATDHLTPESPTTHGWTLVIISVCMGTIGLLLWYRKALLSLLLSYAKRLDLHQRIAALRRI